VSARRKIQSSTEGTPFALAGNSGEADNNGTSRNRMNDPATLTAVNAEADSSRVASDLELRPLIPEHTLFGSHMEKRMGGAFSASLAVHISGVILALIVASLPRADISAPYQPNNPKDIVWLAQPGPGGGGGGGGNQNPAPPQKLQTPGKDQLSVPVQKKPDFQKIEQPKEEPKPEPKLEIPAQTMASAIQTQLGPIDGLPAPTASQGSGTGGGGGTGNGTGSGPGTGPGLGPGWGGGTGGGAYRPGSGVEIPRVIREVKPNYTADAMRAKIQGVVELEAVVLPDGTVGEVNVTRSLDRTFGLDEEARKAVRQWRFVPGTRLGQPVPVLVTIELTFTLR
jgi:periplasmic protein TonB